MSVAKRPRFYLLPIFVLVLTIVMPLLYKNISLWREIKDFSYHAHLRNLNRYPDDPGLLVELALAAEDGVISGAEHRELVNRMLAVHGVWVSAPFHTNHDGSKHLLLDAIKERSADIGYAAESKNIRP